MESYPFAQDLDQYLRLRRPTPPMTVIPLNTDIVVLDRMVFSELGDLDTEEKKLVAIALVNAFLNLSGETKESVAVLLTGQEYPERSDFGPKDRLFSNGRRALASTEFASIDNNYQFITDICIGKCKDPLYGDWCFFNVLDEKYPDFIRRNIWGLTPKDGIRTGMRYGDYEFSPIGFLKARAAGTVDKEHLLRWEKLKKNPIEDISYDIIIG